MAHFNILETLYHQQRSTMACSLQQASTLPTPPPADFATASFLEPP